MTITVENAEDFKLDSVRALLREYATYLNDSVGEEQISLENFETKLASLPVPYQGSNGVILLASANGEHGWNDCAKAAASSIEQG